MEIIDKYFTNKSIFTLKYYDATLEKNYRKYMQELKFIQMRFAPLLTSFFYLWFWFIDFEIANQTQLDKTQYFHLSMIFVLLLPFILSFFKNLHKLMYITLLCAPIYAAFGNIYLATIGMTVYLPDIYLIMMWSFVMAGFYFYEAIILNFIMLFSAILFHFSFNILSANYFEVHIVYILIALVIGAFANYSMEFVSRINFESNNLLKQQQLKIQEINKYTKESIEYASLIQGALMPSLDSFKNYFNDFFTFWKPKDTVGGDIYLFEELRDKDECLLMVIDCTGHGVPGAFVTMLVKAIERQIIVEINNSDKIVSPGYLLSVFNKNMKQLLKQESIDSISNAGFDGAIIYYNKKDKIIKFAGAESALYYIEDKELKTIKGNRYSIGYKKCNIDYEYKEHLIQVKDGMQFYLTTDGYIDQNGGNKGFPFGKKRLTKLLSTYQNETMTKQKEVLLEKLKEYQGKEEVNDDITLIGFKI